MFLASAGQSAVQLWDADLAGPSVSPTTSIAPLDDLPDATRRLAWSPSGQVLAEASSGSSTLRLLRADTGCLAQVTALEVPSLTPGISSVDFSPNSRLMAVSSGSDSFVWDFKRCQYRHCFSDRSSPTIAAMFLSQGCLLTASRNGSIKANQLSQGGSSEDYEGIQINESLLTCVTCSADSKVVTGYEDGSIRIFDASSRRLLQSRRYHSGVVTSADFSPRNQRLVMTGGSDKILLVDTATSSAQPSAKIDSIGKVHSLSFHANAVHFAVGFADGEMMLFDWRNTRTPLAKELVDSGRGRIQVKFQHSSTFNSTRSPVSVTTLSPNQRSKPIKSAWVESLNLPPPVFSTKWKQIESSATFSTKFDDHSATQDKIDEATDDEISKSETGTADTAKILNQLQTPLNDRTRLSRWSKSIDPPFPNTLLDNRTEEMVKGAIKAVSVQELNDALAMLRYDVHKDVQEIIREQVRPFEIAKV